MSLSIGAICAAILRFRYYRVIGRFHILRRAVARLRAVEEALWGHRHARSRGLVAPRQLEALRSRGYCEAPALGEEEIAAIRAWSEQQPCRLHGSKERFALSAVRSGRTPQGAPAAVVDVANPLACETIRRIVEDPLLLETATRHLGYRPRRTRVRLYWSQVVDLSDEERRAAGQTIDFHYDIEACNSLYVYFYLAGGGASSGAHVLVEGSHGPKPFRMAIGSCFQPEERVLERYGADKVRVMAGGPGFGFFEDPSCFHKALVPTEADRLCLQIRYA